MSGNKHPKLPTAGDRDLRGNPGIGTSYGLRVIDSRSCWIPRGDRAR
jgi:hypothetical protein